MTVSESTTMRTTVTTVATADSLEMDRNDSVRVNDHDDHSNSSSNSRQLRNGQK